MRATKKTSNVKKNMFFLGNALPKSNARAHLNQRKKTIVSLNRNQRNLSCNISNIYMTFLAWMTQSPGVPGSNPAPVDIFPWYTHMQ